VKEAALVGSKRSSKFGLIDASLVPFTPPPLSWGTSERLLDVLANGLCVLSGGCRDSGLLSLSAGLLFLSWGPTSGPMVRSVKGWRSSSASWPMHERHRSPSSISLTTCSPRRALRRASCAKKLERPASTRTPTSSLDARSSASRATAWRTGGAETKMRDSSRARAPGGTGHLVHAPSPVESLVGLAG
jgi:hypothetical protein